MDCELCGGDLAHGDDDATRLRCHQSVMGLRGPLSIGDLGLCHPVLPRHPQSAYPVSQQGAGLLRPVFPLWRHHADFRADQRFPLFV